MYRIRNAFVCAAFVLGIFVAPPSARADDAPAKTPVGEWLLLGPVDSPFPAFASEGDKPKPGDLLAYPQLDPEDLTPVAGRKVAAGGGKTIEWKRVTAKDDAVRLESRDEPAVAWLGAYVSVPRWLKIDIEATASQAFELWVDGKSIVKRDKPGDDKKSGSASLVQGKHLLLVKTVFAPGDSVGDWTVGVGVSPAKDFDVSVMLSTDPARPMNIGDVLDAQSVTDLEVSPDGAFFAAGMQRREPPEGTADRWVEIREVRNGNPVRTIRDMSASSWEWAPKGHRLTYVTRNDGAATVRVMNIETGAVETIVEDVKDFTSYSWSPDGTYIAYSVNTEAEASKSGLKLMRGISDKRAGERDRSSLYIASVPEGMTRRITAGDYGTWVYDVKPDGRSILIGRSYEELSDRPYSVEEVYVLDVETADVDLIYKGPWFGQAQWSPDGRKILATGGPDAFDGAGANVPEGMTPNDYDVQAYLIDEETKAVDPITKDFNPSIVSVYWPASGNDIYMVAEDGEFVRLFRYETGKRRFTAIDIDCDVIGGRGVAAERAVAVVTGTSANRPERIYAVDLEGGKAREIMNPARDRFDRVRIGEVHDFNFTTSDGTEIAGRLHLPPDFDESRKWPCIVYYYGGTSPVSRSFGGRYPKNLWAAHGYVVYVLQPSGATGFGQAFSARHVNDWGKTTVGEIIEGTQKMLDAHPFIDRDHVGCIGASFGGFMTELLVTKTDIFAAAVSHAGISMISSYWGEGYWGYGYNAVSAANSFPWNRKDIYIDQSPLFGVENVTTPLLLLHGGADTNVPPGESEQMYTALKLLGKEVEYIKVDGQNHWILDYEKRVGWSNAIVSWFDRWLKDEPEWWNDMFPPLDGEDKKKE